MGNCCRRIEAVEPSELPPRTARSGAAGVREEAGQAQESEPAREALESQGRRRSSGGEVEYLVPDISDIFYKGVAHPLLSGPGSAPPPEGPLEQPEPPGIFRRLGSYPRIADIVLTKDLWRSRILLSVKLSSRYTVGSNAIGYGICGSVNHCVNRRTQKIYALKSLSTYASSKRKLTSVFNEVSIFTQLDHPNIAFMHEAYDDGSTCHIVMEYCAGNELYDRLDTYKRFSEAYAVKMTFQMLLTLNYLHSNGVCHRDLKLENWVFANQEIDSLLKMIDFGFARVFERGIPMGGMHGTVYYVDPEVIDGCYNEKCDVWSTGVIVYMMLSGSPPFNSGGDKEILWKIKKGSLKFEGVRWNAVSELAKDFIRFLLNRNGNERPSAAQAMRHEWLRPELARYSNFRVPREMLAQIVRFSRKSALHRAVIALSVLESDRNCPREVYRAFFAINSSKSGSISFAEFFAAMGQLGLAEAEAAQVFALIGFRNTPELSYTEFVTAVIEHYGTLDINMLSLVYKKLDIFGKGFVDLESFCHAIGTRFGDVDSREIFHSSDLNNDGVIDFVEFCECLTNVNFTREGRVKA